MRDVRWKGLGAAHAYISDVYWEKRDGKTARLRNLNRHTLVQARTATNVSTINVLIECHGYEFVSNNDNIIDVGRILSRNTGL